MKPGVALWSLVSVLTEDNLLLAQDVPNVIGLK